MAGFSLKGSFKGHGGNLWSLVASPCTCPSQRVEAHYQWAIREAQAEAGMFSLGSQSVPCVRSVVQQISKASPLRRWGKRTPPLRGGVGVAHIYGEERDRLWRLATPSHQSLHCLDTKMDSLTNDLNSTSYQIRSFAKERPCPHCSYREEGTSPSLVSEILLLIMNPSNFEGETWGVNSECYKRSLSNSQLQHRTRAKEGRDFT